MTAQTQLPPVLIKVKIPRHSLVIRFFAGFSSVVFHPLFIPLYVTWYLAFIHPGYFAGYDKGFKELTLVRVAINTIFFPLITVLLLKGVGFIDSVFLKTQRDRTIPYIATGTFIFWMYLVFRNQSEIPSLLTAFIFSAFLASSIALILNIYFKVSMHAIGVGGMFGLMLIISNTNTAYASILPLMISILITGIVCTSRLIISNHTQKEIYAGLFCGLLSQFIGAYFIL